MFIDFGKSDIIMINIFDKPKIMDNHEMPENADIKMEVRTDEKSRFEAHEIPRLKKLRTAVLDSRYHLCSMKAELMTDYFIKNDSTGLVVAGLSKLHYQLYKKAIKKAAKRLPQSKLQITLNNYLNKLYIKSSPKTPGDNSILFASALKHILENMELKIYDDELIVGNPSSMRVGAPIHPDLGGIMMMPELEELDTRAQNPMGITKEQKSVLYDDIFPYWFSRSTLAGTTVYSKNPDLANVLLDGRHFVLTQFAGISHVTPDYPSVLKKGFNGIKSEIQAAKTEIEKNLKKADSQKTNYEISEKIKFYDSTLITCDAAITYAKRWKAHLEEKAAEESDENRKKEILNIAEMFSRIPAEPAETLHEALQSLFITHAMLHYESFQHGISFGRMDQFLHEYYENDIKAGRLDEKDAIELIGCFIVKAGELLPLFFEIATEYFSGLSSASGITLGGADSSGKSAINELSYLFLLAYDQVRLRQPNFHVRVSKDSPAEYLAFCCDILKKGGGIPAFFNDEKISAALGRVGISREDAVDYSIVGCVEWGIPGKSFPAAGAIFINMTMALHLALHNGRIDGEQFGPMTGDVETLNSMEAIIAAFRAQLEYLIEMAIEGNNAIETAHKYHRPTPMLSSIVEGCISKGMDVNIGGAKYNSTGCQGVGLADVADSLAAIEYMVFKENKVSLKEFVRIIDDNFTASPQIRENILSRAPRYCRDSSDADAYISKISGLHQEIVCKYENPRGGSYFPGFWSMTTHQGFGARMPALPSGRLKGESLANGASPCNGVDSLGPTAALASASRLDGSRIANGFAFNQKLNALNLRGEKGNSLITGLIKGYFDMGGMQVQFNMMDPETLQDARKHPEKYRDLVVRVSGYSAYFNDLTPEMKDELISRTMHSTICASPA